MQPRPVDTIVPQVVAAQGGCVVVAPPGSGKTTRIPPALLEVVDGKVLLLQPRRVAARACARFIAFEQGWRIGQQIGWRIRFENTCGPTTRLEVLTEGMLTRRLQADPFLDGVGCVVLDEFHERSVHADLALAMLRESGVRTVVMSATLDAGPVAAFLGVPAFEAQGRSFPVEVTHAVGSLPGLVRKYAAADGHTLVFLPGVREIDELARAVSDLEPLRLHGRLDSAQQDKALAPSRRPKMVLSTNVAETSVTLDGVTQVIDTGLAKVPRFDVAAGVDRLELVRISRASADQRAGRAGRTGPGRCLRLWPEKESLRAHDVPEVQRVDLAPAVLQLLAWGADPLAFEWFERPAAGALQAALQLVRSLGDAETLAVFPLHPRLAAALARAHELGAPATLDVLAELSRDGRARRQLERLAKRHLGPWRDHGVDPALALLAGFGDRAGVRRGMGQRYQLADGQGATLDEPGPELLIALEVTGGAGDHRIRRWVPLDSLPTERVRVTEWKDNAVWTGEVEAHGKLIFSRQRGGQVDLERARQLVLENCSPQDLNWDEALWRRVDLARKVDPSLPTLDRLACFEMAAETCRSKKELRAFTGWLDPWPWPARQRLEQLCPTELRGPRGRRLRVRYTEEGPLISARVQHLFGWEDAPRIAGRAPRIELLSPANRPVQLTSDLRGFWAGSYKEVRKEMRGRYPKHDWPEDPTR